MLIRFRLITSHQVIFLIYDIAIIYLFIVVIANNMISRNKQRRNRRSMLLGLHFLISH